VLGGGRGGDFDPGKLLEDPDEVFPWVDLPAAAAFDEAVPDGVGLPGFLAAHEEPVFRAELGRVPFVSDKLSPSF
jgi:hypothetical protein